MFFFFLAGFDQWVCGHIRLAYKGGGEGGNCSKLDTLLVESFLEIQEK